MSYLLPAGDVPVSASWQQHKDRTPPSSEPGTDYACAYGATIYAAGPGTVVDVQTSPSGATGRFLTIALDDGRTVRYLHLSRITWDRGARVGTGSTVAVSGASGYGSDWYYGPHVHTTLWPGAIWAAPTIDFDPFTETDTGDDDMPTADEIAKAVWNYKIQPQDANGNYIPGSFPARGFLSSTDAKVNDIRVNGVPVKIPPETLDAIARQVQDVVRAALEAASS